MSSALKPTHSQLIQELLSTREVTAAFNLFDASLDAITEEQIEICSIPASPFDEGPRAEYLRQKFVEIGLSEVEIDEEGNCLGLLRGSFESPLLVVSAHLDTVFDRETNFFVRREGHRLLAPGISDDGCGLAAIISIARALVTTRTRIKGSILFVGTVGEEGEGNLRGVRYLFTKGKYAESIDSFLSFDGPGVDRITNKALGSRRYRVKATGPGGHSWGDFGVPNPVHALGRAIARLTTYPLPREPRTTFNVGKIEGGTSVNAIPEAASFDIDLRSTDETELKRLDAYFRRIVLESVDQENKTRKPGDGMLTVNLDLLGDRPSGETPAGTELVEIALAAGRAIGVEALLEQSSTDSNLPISLGIPAITLGGGGTAAGSHTLDEWYDPRNRELGLRRGLLTVLGVVGLQG